jgi:hypothetical protein
VDDFIINMAQWFELVSGGNKIFRHAFTDKVYTQGYNTLSIKDPDAIRKIYLSEKFIKSPFYKALSPLM